MTNKKLTPILDFRTDLASAIFEVINNSLEKIQEDLPYDIKVEVLDLPSNWPNIKGSVLVVRAYSEGGWTDAPHTKERVMFLHLKT